jgi:hypothetical protein
VTTEVSVRGAAGTPSPVAGADPVTAGRTWARPDARRGLQLVLATFWVLDGILQLQSFFFTKSFGLQMISGASSGNPSVVARPIRWSATAIGHHAVVTDAVFALVQIGIAAAIAWRPVVKIGLAVSIGWSLAVWWIGEGLGGILNGTANPVNGAPGAVILYALLAVLLWPVDRAGAQPPFIAAGSVGVPIAKALWTLLWGSLAVLSLLGTNHSSQHLRDLLDGERSGEPAWLAWIDHRAAGLVDHRGLVVAVTLAILLAVVALGIYLPEALANATVALALAISLVLWVVGEDFGALFTNAATDVNSGPLLMLLAAAYWRWSPKPGGWHAALDRRFGLVGG